MAEKSFRPLSSPQKVPSYNHNAKAVRKNIKNNIMRDNFTMSTWLLVGGLLQGVAVALLGYLNLLPATMVIAYRIGDNLLMAFGWTKNRYLSDERNPVTPFGVFDPVYLKLAKYFFRMVRELKETAEHSGYLGSATWTSAEDSAANEVMTVMYFGDFESLHKYAHGPFHIQAVKYWSSVVKDCPHVSIYHETYVVPPGQWENIYGNSRPTGLSAASFPIRTAQGNGETEWMSPVIDARKGSLRGMAGRIQSDYLKGYEEKQGEVWDQTYDVDYRELAR
ncbi:hypothetical protein RJZ56_000065 [Blastomyces dermatitidis]